jgi:hypothetical protein
MIINTVFTGSSIRALNGLLATTVPPSRVCSTRDFCPNWDDFAARLTASTKVSLAKSRSGADQRVLKARQFLLQPQSPK